MNEIVSKSLLAGDKFMTEMHLRQPGFTYSLHIVLVDHLQKKKRRKKKKNTKVFKEIGDSRYIYQNELDKSCFQHDMAYGDFKDLNRRKAADKVLRDKSFNIAKNPKHDGYQRNVDLV